MRSAWGLDVPGGGGHRNPAEFAQLPKQTRKELRALSIEEAGRFLSALVGDRCATVLAFALVTGMRPQEYFGPQWKDIDLKQGTATEQRALVWRTKGGGWYYSEPKKSRSRRTLPIPASIVKALVDHKPCSLRLYDLRHFCATLLLQAGENPKVVSERLGHSTITLTLDVYMSYLICKKLRRRNLKSYSSVKLAHNRYLE